MHFAGEHTATLWVAWMNGALESAERVVEEILQADAQCSQLTRLLLDAQRTCAAAIASARRRAA